MTSDCLEVLCKFRFVHAEGSCMRTPPGIPLGPSIFAPLDYLRIFGPYTLDCSVCALHGHNEVLELVLKPQLRGGSDALQVGVDLNLAAQTPWLAHQLQFVGGLGPRKAMAVLKGVQRQEQVAARKAVWKELNVIGKKVFWSVTLTVGPKV